jgi:ADP-heptose:LPS heptosyltransferase
MKALVVRVGNIGDVLMATAVTRTIRRIAPGATIDFLTSPQAHGIVRHNPALTRIFVYTKNKATFLGRMDKRILKDRLHARGYDACFVLEGNPEYKEFIAQALGASCVKIGFAGQGSEWLNVAEPCDLGRHGIEDGLQLLHRFFVFTPQPDDVLMDYACPRRLLPAFKVTPGAKYVVVHPGTTEYLPYRSWVPEGFARTIDFLASRGIKVVVTGRRVHLPLIRQILCDVKDPGRVRLRVEGSFEELAELVRDAAGVLCSDTGVLHLARALSTPVVGLFGPSDPARTGCIGRGVYRSVRNDFPCGPCNFDPEYRREEKKACLDGRPPRCMRSITAEQVEAALRDILGLAGAP